jgi:hypothetical protein
MPALTLLQTGSSRTPIGNAKARTWNCWGTLRIRANNPEHELTHAGIVGFEGQHARRRRPNGLQPNPVRCQPSVIEESLRSILSPRAMRSR